MNLPARQFTTSQHAGLLGRGVPEEGLGGGSAALRRGFNRRLGWGSL